MADMRPDSPFGWSGGNSVSLAMQITRETLLTLGFVPLPGRANWYSYRGVFGRLLEQEEVFYFQGFSLPITTVADLRYLLMLIDANWQSSFVPYPNHYN